MWVLGRMFSRWSWNILKNASAHFSLAPGLPQDCGTLGELFLTLPLSLP